MKSSVEESSAGNEFSYFVCSLSVFQQWSWKNNEGKTRPARNEMKHFSSLYFACWYVVFSEHCSQAIFIFLFWFSCVPALFHIRVYHLHCNACSPYFTHHQFFFRLLSGLHLSGFPMNRFLIFSSRHRVSTMFILFFLFSSILFSFTLFFFSPNSFRYEHDPGDEILDDIIVR